MSIIYFLIPITLSLLFIAICFFFWAVSNDQFDGIDCPAKHIILDDNDKFKK